MEPLIMFMIFILVCFVILIAAFVIYANKNKISIPCENEQIRKYLNEYLIKYNNNESVELTATSKKFPLLISIALCIVLLILFMFEVLTYKTVLTLALAVIGAYFLLLIKKKYILIDKINLQNDKLTFYYGNKKHKTYNLNEIDIKYKIIRESSQEGISHYCYIYVNSEELTKFEIYMDDKFDPLVSFIVFTNIVKEQEINKIDNLSDEDIELLQEKSIYKKVKN